MRKGTPIRRATGRKVWGVWDCKYCNTKVHGSKRECPNCGRPRGDVTGRYRLENPKDYMSEEDVATHQVPDWLCESCDSYNPDTAEVCESCGAERGSKTYFDVNKPKEPMSTDPPEEPPEPENSEVVEDSSDYINRRDRTNQNKRRYGTVFKRIFLVFACISAVLFLFSLLKPTPINFTVLEKTWEYSIEIEEKEVIEDSGWSLPSNARVLNKEWRLKEADKKVLDHYNTVYVEETFSTEVWDHDDVDYDYEDDGNGGYTEYEIRTPVYRTEYYTETVESKEPVYRYEDEYDWYYYYEYDRWRTVRTVTTGGNSSTEPYWGEVHLSSNERQGTKTEEYKLQVLILNSKETKEYNANQSVGDKKYEVQVTAFDDSEIKEYTVNQLTYNKVKVGNKYKGEVSKFGTLSLGMEE